VIPVPGKLALLCRGTVASPVELGGKENDAGECSMVPLYILAAAVSLLILNLLRAEIRKNELSRKTWTELLAELEPVKAEGITLAALEAFAIDDSQPGIDAGELWTMIGGREGLNRMRANAGLLIAVAAHAEGWNFQGSAVTADRMRHDGLAVRNAAMKIKVNHFCGYGKRTAFHVQEAAAAYYTMTERLLTLYETSPSRRYEQLALAVWPYQKHLFVATGPSLR